MSQPGEPKGLVPGSGARGEIIPPCPLYKSASSPEPSPLLLKDMNVGRTVPGEAGAGPAQASLSAMKDMLGPACIFLRKGIAEKQGVWPSGQPGAEQML